MSAVNGIEQHGTSRRLGRGLWVALSAIGVAIVLGSSSVVAGASGSYDPASDGYSMANIDAQTGAAAWWDAGYTGAGVDVAVIDTGVTPVPALSTPGSVVYGPDLSLDSQNPALRNLDGFGHGTFMAGLIAGHDPSLTAPYSKAPAGAYRGIAPDARIVSLKVGAADGSVDVTQVIAAIDWVVQHAHDPGFNIRVINLSYGTNSRQSYTVDPLAYAAEQAWKHGIVVVASAGNSGYQRGHGAPGLADPAYDPYVIGVGAVDTNGTATTRDDDVASFSASACPSCKRPDFVAPGAHLQGLRVPGSYIDDSNPPGILDGSYMRGSGTSEATAITSGAVALILQRYPGLTPDQVKEFILQSTDKLQGTSPNDQGGGELDLNALLSSTPPVSGDQPAHYADSTGTGSLEQARGTAHVSLGGVALRGNIDIFGHPFDATALTAAEAAGTSWSGGTWNGSNWGSNSWSSNSWSGSSWSSNSWSSNSWSSNSWSGSSWSSNSWSSNSWSSNSWSSNSWSSAGWS